MIGSSSAQNWNGLKDLQSDEVSIVSVMPQIESTDVIIEIYENTHDEVNWYEEESQSKVPIHDEFLK